MTERSSIQLTPVQSPITITLPWDGVRGVREDWDASMAGKQTMWVWVGFEFFFSR